MIPKKLHFIWVGDESKMPKACIDTWVQKNPDYECVLWNNDSLRETWINDRQLHEMLDKKDYAGASDIMRYEILFNEGGFYVDIDSVCLKPLEDWLLDCEAFAIWEQEHIRNNLIANGFMGSEQGSDFMKRCIDEVARRDCTEDKLAWLITGPMLVTDVYFKERPNLTVYPSHFFLPKHHTGYVNPTTGHQFADHIWGSNTGYDDMESKLNER
jgi:mannosyltransferase OCH1-like enzyme